MTHKLLDKFHSKKTKEIEDLISFFEGKSVIDSKYEPYKRQLWCLLCRGAKPKQGGWAEFILDQLRIGYKEWLVEVFLEHHMRCGSKGQRFHKNYQSVVDRVVSYRDEDGLTAMHYSARVTGNTSQGPGYESQWVRPELIRLLLELGAKADAVDKLGRTPLHLASEDDVNVVIARQLLDSCPNADIDAEDNLGRTPLHVALLRKQKYMAGLLVEGGADTRKPRNRALWDYAAQPGRGVSHVDGVLGNYHEICDFLEQVQEEVIANQVRKATCMTWRREDREKRGLPAEI